MSRGAGSGAVRARAVRTRGALTVLQAVLVALLLVASGPALAASPSETGGTGSPSPAPGSTTPPTDPSAHAPGVVVALLADLPAALAAVPSAQLGSLADAVPELVAGPIREVRGWNPAARGGDETVPVSVPTDVWVAIVTRDGAPVGLVEVSAPAGESPQVERVTDDADLAAALQAVPVQETLVRGGRGQGWFALDEGRVAPVDEAAREVLAGSMPASTFLAAQATRASAGPTPRAAEVETGTSWGPVLVGGGVLLVLLLVALVVWLQRPDSPEADEEPRAPRGMLALRRPATRAERGETEDPGAASSA